MSRAWAISSSAHMLRALQPLGSPTFQLRLRAEDVDAETLDLENMVMISTKVISVRTGT